MTLALTFPGQGSQFVSMGKAVADEFSDARAVFDEVDEALGEKLSGLIWNGPEDQLKLTANTQPALMAVSLAVFMVMQAKGFDIERAKFVAGHSLGEYSALAASGSISIADTARLLRIRGNAMQDAVPVGTGAMAAIIGLDNDPLEKICADCSNKEESVQIANDNGGGQLVISGHKEPVEKACELAKEQGARRAILLPVSAPFHSSLMEPAAEAMREALAEVKIVSPKIPLVANVLALPISDPDEIRTRLVEQVTGRVRWRESVSFLVDEGVDTLFEIGAGKVLTGLARRIERSIVGKSVHTPEDIDNALESLN